MQALECTMHMCGGAVGWPRRETQSQLSPRQLLSPTVVDVSMHSPGAHSTSHVVMPLAVPKDLYVFPDFPYPEELLPKNEYPSGRQVEAPACRRGSEGGRLSGRSAGLQGQSVLNLPPIGLPVMDGGGGRLVTDAAAVLSAIMFLRCAVRHWAAVLRPTPVRRSSQGVWIVSAR